MGKKNGFTIMEILILLALIGILATGLLIAINPMRQFAKGWDARRKADLALLNKALEDYYNDHGCYPAAADICYDSPTALGNTSYTCHVCGLNSNSPSFEPYIGKLPCDPQSPSKEYLYQFQMSSCPSWYNTYSKFSTTDDKDSISLGCAGSSCGPVPRGYDYGVSSPNSTLNKDEKWQCLTTTDGGITSSCGSCDYGYASCDTTAQCQFYHKYYVSAIACCEDNPSAVNCNFSFHYYCLCDTACILCGTAIDCSQDERCCRNPFRIRTSCP